MPIVIGIIVLLVLVVLAWLTLSAFVSLAGFLFMLLIAGLVGWLADVIVPGKLPFGWLGAIIAGLVGSWLGTLLLPDVGPVIGGIPIIPALVGAIILAFLIELLMGSRSRTTL